MVTVLKDKLMEFHPDTLECVRKDVNLEKEGRIEEAVDLLEEWLKKQQHFVKKDFSRDYLERTLINCKGMVERAKQRIDKLCTFKTLLPELFPRLPSKELFEPLSSLVRFGFLPKLTKDHYRVSLFNLKSDDYKSSDVQNYYRLVTLMAEYLRIHDYCSGYIVVMDFRKANILNFLAKCTPLELGQIITLVTEGYSYRIKQIHLITESKMMDALVTFIKQVLSSKLAGRLRAHKDLDTLYDFVPKLVLPKEYGGEERSLQEISDNWRDAVTSEEFIQYYMEMNKAKTDESYRPASNFNEQYIGMPGSFRALRVD